MIPDYFKEYPQEPTELTVANAIARQIDGLGFRLYWAVYDLNEKDCDYVLCQGAKSIRDILHHILSLVNWVYMNVFGQQMNRPEKIIDQAIETLLALEKLRKELINMSDQQLQKCKLDGRSFWSFINMPLADATSHVGQVSMLRRAAGNPNKMDDYFRAKN